MQHRYFDDRTLDLLLDPGAWRIVATALPPKEVIAADPARQRWRLRNTHAHAHREILIALEGEQIYGHAVGAVCCRPGTILYIDRLEAHDNGYLPGTSGFCHLWCSLTAAGVLVRKRRTLASGATTAQALPLSGWDDALSGQLSAILDRHRAVATDQARLARLDLMTVATSIIARLVESGWQPETTDASRAANAVDLACRHIVETRGVGISLDGLAQLTCYSRFHFLRLFRAQAGCSLREFIDQVRRDEVRRVRQQGGGARAAAAHIGFASASAFSRWCRRNGVVWRAGQQAQ